ncbi:hypothetical protein vBRpoSV10_49 [Ruegeria phage vB_RpoS-V10]|nr:hypothetical protein vBRpoSV10_49 [Ruegeria phage vB_RpoS-V10]
MKTTSPQFRNHLDSEVTAICTCWQIERRDGVTLRFTDADEDVTVEGDTYLSIGAYSRSAIESTSSLSVDNLDVSGMATELALPIEELRAGAYDNATVKVFMTSWMGAVTGILKLRRGFFGEVRVLPNGTFTVELRGIMQRLAHTYTKVFSATCRHDLGDANCGVNLNHPFQTAGANIPFPIKDSDFEEVGLVGFGGSNSWYNPQTSEEMIDAGTTYSGTYAAHATAGGGILRQDVDLNSMSEEFLSNIDTNQVTFTSHAWRRDDGDTGRLTYTFLDPEFRPLRNGGVMDINNTPVTIPEITIAGDFTFEAWINPTALYGQYDGFFGKWGAGYSRMFFMNNNRIRFFWSTSGATGFIETADEYFFPVGEWFHLAFTRVGDVGTIYLNGSVVAQGSFPATNDFTIDRIGSNDLNGAFDGYWDEIRIWDTGRSRAQINRYRFIDLPDTTPNLRRYYPFDADSNDQGEDDSGVIGTGSFTRIHNVVTPVAVSHRGTDRTVTTGYEDVGGAWTLRSIEDAIVPPHTRHVRVSFDHAPVAGTPEGTRVDGFFGWFNDAANTKPYPNLNIGADTSWWTRGGMVTSGNSNRIFNAIIDEPRAVEGWFHGGLITFYSGDNAGASMEIKRWTAASGQVELFLSLPYPIMPGDLFTIYPGCDKSRVCCTALFDNIVQFFGTPDVPGEDELFRYPDAK